MRDAPGLAPAACAELLRRSSRVVALTGAGISTAAGAPDFRGPQGLYVTRRYDPDKVFAIEGFRRTPEYFYEFSRDFVATMSRVETTFTHRFLAELERRGVLAGVVTQNIDMLHQQAGSRQVLELHGSYGRAFCLACGKRYRRLDYAWWQVAMEESSTPPIARCSACDGVLKPEIVFFGELVSSFGQAEALIAGCDLLLVLGSTLQVAPAALLPRVTSAPVVIVNRGEVGLPRAPGRMFVDADLDAYFQAVARQFGSGNLRVTDAAG